MSNEQNIEDILKLLKDSVADDHGSNGDAVNDWESAGDKHDDINDEVLKDRLKMQYMDAEPDKDVGFDFFDGADEEKDGYNSYSIDDEFLEEAVAEKDDIDVSPEEIPEQSEEPEEEAEPFAFFEPASPIASSTDDVAPWETEVQEDAKEDVAYDETSFFDIPEELSADTAEDNEPMSEEAEDDDMTFEDLAIASEPQDEDDDYLGVIEDHEMFEEPATFSLYDSNSDDEVLGGNVPTADTEDEYTDGNNGPWDVPAESFTDIVIDSTETGKALDFDVYAPLDPDKSEAPVDLYSLFREEKAKAKEAEKTEDLPKADTVDEIQTEAESDEAETPAIPENESLDFSEMNIMIQLGFEDELKTAVGEEKVDDFVRYDIADKEKQRVESEKRKIDTRSEKADYISPEQNDAIKERYRAESIKSLIKFLGVTAIALLIGIIELAPILGVRLEGVLDYNAYPALYMLFGSQLLILAAAVIYKSMISGLIYAFSAKPTRHSAVALSVAVTILYDVIMILIVAASGEDYPSMFNGLAAFMLVISAGVDYVMIMCDRKTFNVYSVNEAKYTLVDESASGRIKEKLVRGGVESSKNVYIPESVDFPYGFKQLCKTETEWKLVKIFTIPVLMFSIVALIVNMSLGRGLAEVAGTLMMSFCMSMPIMIIVSETLPCFIATLRLEKRGSAVAGSEMYKKFSECDMIVFDDTYLFEKCRSEDIGVAIYDTSVGYLALGCFKALYDKIGGPLADLNIELPEAFRFEDVKIRRISKNGIDAIVDGRHSLLVGDYAFMQRYGLSFPKSESDKIKGVGILCLSLNQKVTAKISVKYDTVEIFEMLAQRLSEDGITPIITTADPLINSSLIAKNRTLGDAPIGVVHKNSNDLETGHTPRKRYDPDGIISCISDLKLAEALVWCKRVEKIRRLCETVVTIFSAAGILLSIFAMLLGIAQYFNQVLITLYLIVELVVIGAITFANIPDKDYFSVKGLREELAAEELAQKNENERSALKVRDMTADNVEPEEKKDKKEKKKLFNINFISFKKRKKDQDEQK